MKREKSIMLVAGVCLVVLLAMLFGACTPQATPAPATPAPATPAPATPAPATPAPATPAPATPAPATPATPAKVYQFDIAHFWPAANFSAIYTQDWADMVTKNSNGQLKFRLYPSGSLLAATENWPGVSKGVADLGSGFRYESFGKDLQEFTGYCMLGAPNSIVAQKIEYDVWKKFPAWQAEWSANKVLVLGTTSAFVFHNNVREARTPADAAGLQIRAANAYSAGILKSWGATGVFAPMSDAYDMLSKNTVQGVYAGSDILKSFRIAEVCKTTSYLNSIYGTGYYLCMNWDSYNSLPKNLQQVIDDSIPWLYDRLQPEWEQQTQLAIDFAKSLNKGYTFVYPTQEELDKWYAPVYPLLDGWAAGFDAKGLPGTEILKFVQGEVKAARTAAAAKK